METIPEILERLKWNMVVLEATNGGESWIARCIFGAETIVSSVTKKPEEALKELFDHVNS